MKRKIFYILVIAILIATIPVNALDNSGGGNWKRVDVFLFKTSVPTYTQYCITINGDYVNITNSTGYVKATLYDPYFWNTVNTTGKDIRFTNQSSELYFWIQSWNATSKEAKIWVNVTEGSYELKMYYGNPVATTSQYLNGSKTFMFFDDFNTLSSKWIQMTGTWSITNGKLYVSSDYGSPPGNNIIYTGKIFNSNKCVVYTEAICNYEAGIDLNTQGSTISSAFDLAHLTPSTETIGILEWVNSTWSTETTATISPVNAGDIVIEMAYQKGTTIYQKAVDLNTHATATNSRTLTYALTSGYIGLHISAGFTTSTEFNWVFVANSSDPVLIEKVYTTHLGSLINNTTITNITYNAYNITGNLLVNNSTTTVVPVFRYIPSNTSATGFLATGVTNVGGNLNITIYLYKKYTLNKVICNSTPVTPNYLGDVIINNKEYSVFNFTSPSAGELIITANVTPYYTSINTSTIYLKDAPTLEIIQQKIIDNVNRTYGANIKVYVNNKTQLYSAIYNNSILNMTYIGNTTKNGVNYREYAGKIYCNGLLNITTTIHNLAYNVSVYADGSRNFTEVLVGEPIKIITPAVSNVTIDGTHYYGNKFSITFKHPHVAYIQIKIFNTSLLQFGLHSIVLNVEWGSVNIILKGYNNQTMNCPISIYNINYSTLCTDPHTLFAGWNKITVYYLGQPIKEYEFYLNHSNQNMNILLNLNATSINSTCYRIYAASPTSFKLTNLNKLIPYGKFAINHTGEVILHFANNSPATVTVEGSKYSYYAPYLYIYGSGNATITSYYILKVDAENALGMPMNISIRINSKNTEIYGRTNKVLPVNKYTIEFPKIYSGFMLKNDSLSNITLNLTSNKELPTAIYKIPTYISLFVYKINSTSFKFPIPLPFTVLSTNTGLQRACIDGKLYNWYDTPVPYANVTIMITSLKTGYTIIRHVNTGTTGTFNVTFDVARGVNYSISVVYKGSNIYVESYKHTVVEGGVLPPAPSSKHNLILLSAIAITILCIGIGSVGYIIHKRSLSKAQRVIEKKSKFFRRVK